MYTATLAAPESVADSTQFKAIRHYLMTHPKIQQVSVSSFNTPFSTNTISYLLTYQAKKLFANVRFVYPAYASILAIDISRGGGLLRPTPKLRLLPPSSLPRRLND
ncbi:hypothetical protein [Spirosoma pomorum]